MAVFEKLGGCCWREAVQGQRWEPVGSPELRTENKASAGESFPPAGRNPSDCAGEEWDEGVSARPWPGLCYGQGVKQVTSASRSFSLPICKMGSREVPVKPAFTDPLMFALLCSKPHICLHESAVRSKLTTPC